MGKYRNYRKTMSDIIMALDCETYDEFLRVSGFNSRQALRQWLLRNGYIMKRKFVLISLEDGEGENEVGE
jgi:hypothetical protein